MLFFFNDTATTEIYTLSLHDALPICWFEHVRREFCERPAAAVRAPLFLARADAPLTELLHHPVRSEEHTSELQSHLNLVCRLLLEKKKLIPSYIPTPTAAHTTLRKTT